MSPDQVPGWLEVLKQAGLAAVAAFGAVWGVWKDMQERARHREFMAVIAKKDKEMLAIALGQAQREAATVEAMRQQRALPPKEQP